ncbi:Hypothetical_protein [Hexamita inflata]|uniref:Hypothetical_protein n=1 Tax=Hexamita inflata TaxID=28002 RepID=A0AA86QWF1_9EUKA|nr:Hypothetical protein HINF_LOCUS54949 [Hexamita inflata]
MYFCIALSCAFLQYLLIPVNVSVNTTIIAIIIMSTLLSARISSICTLTLYQYLYLSVIISCPFQDTTIESNICSHVSTAGFKSVQQSLNSKRSFVLAKITQSQIEGEINFRSARICK